jgi:hypothetical protein
VAAQTTTVEDAEHDRWRKLFEVAAHLAVQHERSALTVRHAARWLEQTGGHLRDGEIVVTWSVADAELVRHQLRDRLPRGSVFPAAPRVRRSPPGMEIPAPREHGSS